MHYAVELGIVLRGRLERKVVGRRWALGRGEAWTIGAWEPHDGRVLEEPCEVVVVFALPQALARMPLLGEERVDWLTPFVAPAGERPAVRENRRKEMARAAEKLGEYWNSDTWTPVRRAWVHVHVMEILLMLMEDWSPRDCGDAVPSVRAYAAIEKALDMVFTRRDKVTVAEAAEACLMSPVAFHQLFSKTMGMGFGEFALKHRVAGAGAQLRDTNDPVKKVTHDWRFTDSNHLGRLVRAHYGCSPTEYRRRSRKAKS